MKRIISILTFTIAILITFVGFSYSQAYTIKQITNNSTGDDDPQISNNGNIVWVGNYSYPVETDIFLYDGSNILPLTDDDTFVDTSPKINNENSMIWIRDGELFIYDILNNSSQQISDPNALYMVESPQLNDNGYAVWEDQHWCIDEKIVLYNGTNNNELNSDYRCNEEPQINDNNYVVWTGTVCDKFAGACEIYDSDILLYKGFETINLSSEIADTKHHRYPQINNNNYVAWEGSDGNDREIYLYNGTIVENITENNEKDGRPRINDSNYIVWECFDGNDNEICLYNGIDIIQITDNDHNDGYPFINKGGKNSAFRSFNKSDN